MAAKLLRARLLNSAGVTAIVADRIHLQFLPAGSTLPAVSFLQVGDSPQNTLEGETNLKNQRWQIDCWAERYGHASELAAAVATAMAENESGFTAVRLGKETEFEDQTKEYRVMLEYSIWFY